MTTVEASKPASPAKRAFKALLIPFLAVVTGLILGGLMIALSDPVVLRSLNPNPWRVVTAGPIDPETDISLEFALSIHPPEVGLGDYVVFLAWL